MDGYGCGATLWVTWKGCYDALNRVQREWNRADEREREADVEQAADQHVERLGQLLVERAVAVCVKAGEERGLQRREGVAEYIALAKRTRDKKNEQLQAEQQALAMDRLGLGGGGGGGGAFGGGSGGGAREWAVVKESEHVFTKKAKDWGFREFMPLKKLEDERAGYLNEGTITIGVQLEQRP